MAPRPHDGWLDPSQDLCKVTFTPSEGSIVLHDTKPSFGGSFASDYIFEEFVVHDSPIEVKSIKKLSKKEKEYYNDLSIQLDPYAYEYP